MDSAKNVLPHLKGPTSTICCWVNDKLLVVDLMGLVGGCHGHANYALTLPFGGNNIWSQEEVCLASLPLGDYSKLVVD